MTSSTEALHNKRTGVDVILAVYVLSGVPVQPGVLKPALSVPVDVARGRVDNDTEDGVIVDFL